MYYIAFHATPGKRMYMCQIFARGCRVLRCQKGATLFFFLGLHG